MDRTAELSLAGSDFGTRTLRQLAEEDALFVIPIYQRPYVWGKEQIGILLDDLWRAYEEGRGMFYLGSTLVRSSGQLRVRYELIDGQQRFTTLWLFSLVAKRVQSGSTLDAWCQPRCSDEPRIAFEIREEINEYFAALLGDRALPELPADHAALAAALAQMETFLRASERGAELHDFCDFVMGSVHLVLSEVPAESNLIRLFELINNRGEQLRPQDILKARLLEVIDATRPDVYPAYASLWEACAEMRQYLERGLPLKAKRLAGLFERQVDGRPALALASQVLAELRAACGERHAAGGGLTLAELLDEPLDDAPPAPQVESQAAAVPDDLRPASILSFPLLLLHVLRLWLRRPGCPPNFEPLPRIDEKQLLALFDEFFLDRLPAADPEAAGAAVAELLALLWEVRFCFDRWVVKNHRQPSDSSGNLLAIRACYVDEQSVRRKAPASVPSRLEMLQSLLYYSQPRATQYWLTPYLAFLLDAGEPGEAACFDYLRRLDNHLFCSGAGRERPLVERTNALLVAPTSLPVSVDFDDTELMRADGTGTRQYWFYKLEFVLWYENLKAQPHERRSGWDGYRVRSRNSVEHIFPQTPPLGMAPLETALLDSFGNLALTSRSFNSSQGNDSPSMKKQRFEDYRRVHGQVESLKMSLIFEYPLLPEWGQTVEGRKAIERHRDEMVDRLRKYCGGI